MLGFINKAFGGRENTVSHKETELAHDQKIARLTEVDRILSNIAMAEIKGKSDMIEDHSDKNIDALLAEKQQLESDLDIPTT